MDLVASDRHIPILPSRMGGTRTFLLPALAGFVAAMGMAGVYLSIL